MVVPHWNQAVVGQPLGLTAPLSVALPVETALAGNVETCGGPNVAKLWSPP
jgi:hypothetical protein